MFKEYVLKVINDSIYELIELLKQREDITTVSKESLEELDYKVFKSLTTTIHFLVDFMDRIETIESGDKELFNAYRFVNNALKHKRNLIRINEIKGYFTFPISFPLKPSSYRYEWTNTTEIEDMQRKEQKEAYDKFLKGKSIISTINIINNAINKYEL